MYYFIFLLLSPLIEVLSNHPPNFKFLTPLGDSSSHIFVTHLFLLHLFVGWGGQIRMQSSRRDVELTEWHSHFQRSALSVVWSQMFYLLFSLCKAEDSINLFKRTRRILFVFRVNSTFQKYTRISYLTMCICQKYFNLPTHITLANLSQLCLILSDLS